MFYPWRNAALISSFMSQFSTVVCHGDIVVSDCKANKHSAGSWRSAHAVPSETQPGSINNRLWRGGGGPDVSLDITQSGRLLPKCRAVSVNSLIYTLVQVRVRCTLLCPSCCAHMSYILPYSHKPSLSSQSVNSFRVSVCVAVGLYSRSMLWRSGAAQ